MTIVMRIHLPNAKVPTQPINGPKANGITFDINRLQSVVAGLSYRAQSLLECARLLPRISTALCLGQVGREPGIIRLSRLKSVYQAGEPARFYC
jgi:hypothetical protein